MQIQTLTRDFICAPPLTEHSPAPTADAGCLRAAYTWRPWVSGLVGHFVQTWPDSELLSHSAVLYGSPKGTLGEKKSSGNCYFVPSK